jgi:hypothetical protein
LRTATVRRTVAAALVAGAFGTTGGVAQAAPQQDDFTGGASTETALIGGAIELATFDHSFNGAPTLPASWIPGTAQTIAPCGPGGQAAIAGDALSVDAARSDSGLGGAGSSLRFTATFAKDEPYQHVGFGVDFGATETTNPASTNWAIFSTAGTGVITARSKYNTASEETPFPTVETGVPHVFQIDWTATSVTYTVDNLAPVTHNIAITGLTAQASDCTSGKPLSVDAMRLRSKATGSYTSKVFDAGDMRVGGIQFAPAATTTPTQSIAYKVRSGNTPPTGDAGWVDWSPSSPIAPGRYFQYRATLTTDDITKTPRLTGASVDFQIAPEPQPGTGNQPPSGGGTPTGDTKKPKLGMPRDADVSKRGKVRLLLTCPDDEQRCKVALKFKWNGDTVASKSGNIDGGDSRYISLKLSKAAKRKLAKAGKLKIVATLTVTDAAGNKRTSSKKIWLYSV